MILIIPTISFQTIGDSIAAVPLAAHDPDVTDALTYSLTVTGSNLFQLDTTGSSPVLQYAGRVDFESMPQPAVYFLSK